jgi:glycosyltransferase involved in cell wall biosynthesis
LKNLERPDLVFIGFPPIETAWRLSIWLKKRSIPYFVDAKDAWPDIFLKYFSKRTAIIIRSLLLPYSLATKFVFRNARGIIAPSEAYLKWGLDKANRDKSQNDLIAPLSSPEPSPSRKLLREAQQYWKELGITKTSQIKIFFVGSLTDSYDFDPLIQLAKTSKMKVVIAGDGPQKNQLLASATEIKNLVVPGWIDQAKYQVLANLCDFSIIPINNRFHLSSSITNKYVDSLRFGKPILTSDLEIANQYLIPENIGASFSIDNLEDTIIALKSNNKNYNIMRKKARLIYLKNFEFKNVYRVLIELLEQTNSNLR